MFGSLWHCKFIKGCNRIRIIIGGFGCTQISSSNYCRSSIAYWSLNVANVSPHRKKNFPHKNLRWAKIGQNLWYAICEFCAHARRIDVLEGRFFQLFIGIEISWSAKKNHQDPTNRSWVICYKPFPHRKSQFLNSRLNTCTRVQSVTSPKKMTDKRVF